MLAIQEGRSFTGTIRLYKGNTPPRLPDTADGWAGSDGYRQKWFLTRVVAGWTLMNPDTELFLGVEARTAGARVVPTPIATAWQLVAVDAHEARVFRLMLAGEKMCLTLDDHGVPRLCTFTPTRGKGEAIGAGAGQFWRLEEHEPCRGVDHKLDNHIEYGTTGWVSYLLGLPSA